MWRINPTVAHGRLPAVHHRPLAVLVDVHTPRAVDVVLHHVNVGVAAVHFGVGVGVLRGDRANVGVAVLVALEEDVNILQKRKIGNADIKIVAAFHLSYFCDHLQFHPLQ